jgi:dipeptidyl aminopeptidase/acylaminoacyl peptidase
LFYYRGSNGGLILTYNGKLQRINTKAGDMYAGTVYPAWHPSLPFIAFSTDVIKQLFYSYDAQKIEPFDYYSDLVLYDIKRNEITAILRAKDKQETTPCWSPDGKYLYFASSDSSYEKSKNPHNLLYNLYRIKFKATNKTWGTPELIYNATSTHHSACFPRISIEGYLLFVLSDYGMGNQTHKSADLYLLNTRTGACRNLVEVNSPTEADSYHDWSGNGRWIVVSSRRQDGNYARPYFAYFDRKGKAYKPFVIPREDPRHDDYLLKNYNVTEFAKAPIVTHQCDIQAVIDAPAKDATYGSPIDKNAIDASSGASTVK